MEAFKKADSEKCRLELIDPHFISGVGYVLTFGANKYGPNNWKKATEEDIERVKGAMMRHQTALMAGEVFDPETNLQHAYHIATNAMFLAWFERNKKVAANEGATANSEDNQ